MIGASLKCKLTMTSPIGLSCIVLKTWPPGCHYLVFGARSNHIWTKEEADVGGYVLIGSDWELTEMQWWRSVHHKVTVPWDMPCFIIHFTLNGTNTVCKHFFFYSPLLLFCSKGEWTIWKVPSEVAQCDPQRMWVTHFGSKWDWFTMLDHSIWSITLLSQGLGFVGCFSSCALTVSGGKMKPSMTQARALLHHFWYSSSPAERVCGMSALWQGGDANEQSQGCVCERTFQPSTWLTPCPFIMLLHTCSFSLCHHISCYSPVWNHWWTSQHYQSHVHHTLCVIYRIMLSFRCLCCMWLFSSQSFCNLCLSLYREICL